MMRHDNPESRSELGARLDLPSATPGVTPPQLADDAEETFPGTPAPEMIHRWLDGESVPAEALAAPDAEKQVQFWAAMNRETARRRAVVTPAHISAVIMEKLHIPVVKDD